jgi:HAD superfamily hydrolase (TIGR01509 family)
MLVAFDLMDTLVTDPYRAAHEAATGMTFEAFERVRPDGVYHALERGDIGEDEYWRRLADCGITVSSETFHDVRRGGYRWLPGMRDLVRDCARSHRVVVASNYPDWIEDVRRDLLDDIECYASYHCGVRKPEPEFFTCLCAAYDVPVTELVLVDDKPENCAAVDALGGTGVVFTGEAAARAALRRAGVLPEVPA